MLKITVYLISGNKYIWKAGIFEWLTSLFQSPDVNPRLLDLIELLISKHHCYTFQLKDVFRSEDNASRFVGQNALTL